MKRFAVLILFVALACGLIGCSFGGGRSIHIDWAEGGRTVVARAISGGPYTAPAPTPHIAMGFAAICKDSAESLVPAFWSVSDPTMLDIQGPSGEDLTTTRLDTIVCEGIKMGDVNLTADAGIDSETVRVRCLGALELNWPSGPATVYFRLHAGGAEQLPSADGADMRLNYLGGTNYTLTCLNGCAGKAYPEREGYETQYEWEPTAAELTDTDLNMAENYAFINGDGDIVTVTISGLGRVDGLDVYYFLH
jgi:hypothetical protein